eukprot:gene1279-biopygen16772
MLPLLLPTADLFAVWGSDRAQAAPPGGTGGTGHARATPAPPQAKKMPTARATPAPCPRHARASVLFPQDWASHPAGPATQLGQPPSWASHPAGPATQLGQPPSFQTNGTGKRAGSQSGLP